MAATKVAGDTCDKRPEPLATTMRSLTPMLVPAVPARLSSVTALPARSVPERLVLPARETVKTGDCPATFSSRRLAAAGSVDATPVTLRPTTVSSEVAT